MDKRDLNVGRRGRTGSSQDDEVANDVTLYLHGSITKTELIKREKVRRETQHQESEAEQKFLPAKPKRLPSLEDSAISDAVEKRIKRIKNTAT
jgi:hypothetical protein